MFGLIKKIKLMEKRVENLSITLENIELKVSVAVDELIKATRAKKLNNELEPSWFLNGSSMDSEEDRNIKRIAKLKYVKDNPSLRTRMIFHGGCLSCTSQKAYGIGRCLDCQYIEADWSKRDLSTHNN